MKVIIHGTTGGYNTFHSDDGSPSGSAWDVRSISSSEYAVGSHAYSIALINNGYLLSKYVIVRDVYRSMATGFVAFTVYLSNKEKVSGHDGLKLLNELWLVFKEHHLKDGYNLDRFNENWEFVSDAKRAFEDKIKINNSRFTANYSTGKANAAYIYYDSEQALEEYLDAPYLDEYRLYKQVFFVESRYENKQENPLRALKHDKDAQLTNVDPKNKKYELQIDEIDGFRISVTRGDGTSLRNGNIVKSKDVLRISYSKKYYYNDNKEGSVISLIDLKIIKEEKEKVIIGPIELEKEEQEIKFSAKNWKGVLPYTDYKLFDKQSNVPKKLDKEIANFRGDEKGRKYTFKVFQNGREKHSKDFVPEKTAESKIEINIQESKNVKLTIKGSGSVTPKHEIYKYGRPVNSNGILEFNDREIEVGCEFSIRAKGYEEKRINAEESKKYQNGGEIILTLVEKSNKVKGDKIEKRKSKRSILSIFKNGIFWIAFGTIGIALASIYFASKFGIIGSSEDIKEVPTKVITYVEGNDLKAKKLNSFDEEYCSNDAFITVCKKIENAQSIRRCINVLSIEKLTTLEYTDEQSDFCEFIKGIDKSYYSQLSEIVDKEKLNLEQNDLNQIVETLDELICVLYDYNSLQSITLTKEINAKVNIDSLTKEIDLSVQDLKIDNSFSLIDSVKRLLKENTDVNPVVTDSIVQTGEKAETQGETAIIATPAEVEESSKVDLNSDIDALKSEFIKTIKKDGLSLVLIEALKSRFDLSGDERLAKALNKIVNEKDYDEFKNSLPPSIKTINSFEDLMENENENFKKWLEEAVKK